MQCIYHSCVMGHIYLGKDSFEKLRLSRPKQLENKSTKGSLYFLKIMCSVLLVLDVFVYIGHVYTYMLYFIIIITQFFWMWTFLFLIN